MSTDRISIDQWRNFWYRERSKEPWQLHISNSPILQQPGIDEAPELEIESRGPCGSIDDPLEAGQPLIIRAYPMPTIGREGLQLPLCVVNELLTLDTTSLLLSALLTIRQIFALDTLDSLCLVVHTALWHYDWKTYQADGMSILSRPYMDKEIDSLDGQAEFFIAEHSPCSTIETLLGFWNTIGLRGANAYLKSEPTPNRKITYTQIPPRLLSETETRVVYGVASRGPVRGAVGGR